MDSATFQRDFAYIAPDAAQLLADAGVLLVGVDYISAEQFGSAVIVLPLKVAGHEGAPATAIVRNRRADQRSRAP
jgi:kynurenine formamidase